MSKRKSGDDWDGDDPEFWRSVVTPPKRQHLDNWDDDDDPFWNSIRTPKRENDGTSKPTPKRRCLPPLPADDWDDDGWNDILGNYSAENQVGGGFVPLPSAPPEVGEPSEKPPPEVAQQQEQPPAGQPEVAQPSTSRNAPHMNFNDLFTIRKTGEQKAKKFGLSMFIYAIDVAPLPFNLDNATSLLVLPELFSAIYRVCTSEFLPDDKIIITMSCQNLDLGKKILLYRKQFFR